MALSDQLRNIASAARAQTDQQSGIGQAANVTQLQQAVAQQPVAGPRGKAAAQSMAGAVTQAQQQIATQAAGQQAGTMAQLGQQALQQQGQQQQQQLQQQQMLNEGQIRELQREGALKQNSSQLKQAKRLQQGEIDLQSRLLSTGLAYENQLSFLTRKQRQDLADLGQYTKQQLFDSRLAFQQDEMGRKFSNQRQLADYAVASAESEEQLKVRLREMQQAAEFEIMALEAANKKLDQRLRMEFQRDENKKDYELMAQLAEMKRAMEAKMRRKRANAAANNSIITGAFTVAGAVIGGVVGAGAGGVGAVPGAMMGASAGSAAGQFVSGGLQSSGAY